MGGERGERSCRARILEGLPAPYGLLMNLEHVARVADLNARYADAIDADRLEAWPDFFLDDGRYRITTAENVMQGLPLTIMFAASQAILRVRVMALLEANVCQDQCIV